MAKQWLRQWLKIWLNLPKEWDSADSNFGMILMVGWTKHEIFGGSNSGDKTDSTSSEGCCSFPWKFGMIFSGCQELALIQLILNYYPDGDEA